MSLNEKMTALADEVRELSGTTTSKSLDAMASDLHTANEDINTQAELIDEIAALVATKAAGSGAEVTYEEPTITISQSGLITATANEKTSVLQMPTKGYVEVVPSTDRIVAVSQGEYVTGTVSVKGDAQLLPHNIKAGVDIFGVVGTYEGSSNEGETWQPVYCTVKIHFEREFSEDAYLLLHDVYPDDYDDSYMICESYQYPFSNDLVDNTLEIPVIKNDTFGILSCNDNDEIIYSCLIDSSNGNVEESGGIFFGTSDYAGMKLFRVLGDDEIWIG